MANHKSEKEEVERVFDPMWSGIPEPREDTRLMDRGSVIPARYYADQPYLTATADGGLLCVVTTGTGHEGSRGQHVVSIKSFDGGKNWESITPVEDPDCPESSWGIPFTAPSGRVFVFYVHNTDDIRELPADDPPYPGGKTHRMDSHGYYVFRWSDDHGKTWSTERGNIPMREFAIDRENSTGGRVRLFWNVGKAFSHGGSLFLPLHKVGGLGEGWFTRSEGCLLQSDDLLTIDDPLVATWETLPDGEVGIRAPEGGGSISEEHSFTILEDGSFFTVFRTIDGYPACAYSRDRGRTWSPSRYMRYADGRAIKNPRSANFVWKLPDGGYLYWFHNHGGKPMREHPQRRTHSYTGRNPVWFCRGWEVDGPDGRELSWAEPEIGLYHDDPMIRMSYPDFHALEDGTLLLTETQKAVARIHRIEEPVRSALSIDPRTRGKFLDTLRPCASWKRSKEGDGMDAPTLPALGVRSPVPPYGTRRTSEGFCMDFGLHASAAGPATVAEFEDGGLWFRLIWSRKRTLEISLCDGESRVDWESDSVPKENERVRFTVNIDGGSNVVSFARDGIFDDGGDERDFGWGRISPHFRGVFTEEIVGDLSDHSLSDETRKTEGNKRILFPSTGSCSLEWIDFYQRILTMAEIEILVDKQGIRETEFGDKVTTGISGRG